MACANSCIPACNVLRKNQSTQTYDEEYIGICTSEGEEAVNFYRYIKWNSPDILPLFIPPSGLPKAISYAPWKYFIEKVDPSEITEDTIVDCAGGTKRAHDYWGKRKSDILKHRELRRNLQSVTLL
jgi:hypothetical protein